MYGKLLHIVIIIFVSLSFNCFAQGTFHLPNGVNSVKIPVEVTNNLVILPVTVNGTELSFLLDSGVKSNVLFSIDDQQDLKLNDAVTIYLTGAGSGEPTKGIKSQHNIINVGEASAIDQNIYFITDASYNFSSRLGHAVNGIIGYSIFKDFVVEVDYKRKFVVLHKPENYKYRRCKTCFTAPLTLVAGKPYIDLDVAIAKEEELSLKLLVDSGSGDALWLFEESHAQIKAGEKYFEDILGLGLNGDVLGKRTKVASIKLGKMELNDVTAAFPNIESLKNMRLHENRNGSLGAEVLRRFTVIFDYPSQKITMRKNNMFNLPFRYNRSGLIVQHSDYELVKEVANNISNRYGLYDEPSSQGTTVFKATNTIQFKLKPSYEIAAIRSGSPAEEAGLQEGDKLLKVNGRDVSNLKLDDITQYFFKDDGAMLRLKVERSGIVFNCKFALRKML